ncbi:MAG: hypothetical protein CM1200mP27_03420 [Chloroflexota bacterium]|nr:MAG: hypothetical protein CM1200mP27_03420 [Chloroflexota bacterium]
MLLSFRLVFPIAAAYVIKGKIGAALLLIPTLGYITVAPTLIEGLITLDTDEDIGAFSYVLGPFWLFTIPAKYHVYRCRGTRN